MPTVTSALPVLNGSSGRVVRSKSPPAKYTVFPPSRRTKFGPVKLGGVVVLTGKPLSVQALAS